MEGGAHLNVVFKQQQILLLTLSFYNKTSALGFNWQDHPQHPLNLTQADI